MSIKGLPVYFVTGPAGSGKSSSIRSTLAKNQTRHIWIQAQYYDSLPPIIRQIAHALSLPDPISNVRELVEALYPARLEHPFLIVIEGAEALLQCDQRALGLLCKLRQFCPKQTGISVVLMSRRGWAEFGQLANFCHPFIISLRAPQLEPIGPDSFFKFVQDMTVKQHRNMPYTISTLNYYHSLLTQANSGQPPSTNKEFSVLQKKTRVQWNYLMNAKKLNEADERICSSLTVVERYVLMACHLACNISPKNDTKVFGLSGGRKMKGSSVARQSSVEQGKEMGKRRKVVPLERLSAIFYMIYCTKERAPPRSLLLPALTKLVELKLILRMTPSVKLDSYKFKSNAPLSLVSAVATALSFPYTKYLFTD